MSKESEVPATWNRLMGTKHPRYFRRLDWQIREPDYVETPR